MFTPQQIEEISFSTATFGGYDKQSVDSLLEPLTEDYITLYKENAQLKSKLRELVGKLREYIQNENSIKEAMESTQANCDSMVQDTQEKCSRMLQEANEAVAVMARNAAARMEEEELRVQEARRVAGEKIDALQGQLRSCLDILDRIKGADRSAKSKTEMFDVEAPDARTKGMADQISISLEELVGTTQEEAPKPQAKHPTTDATTKFGNLQFGRNYSPDGK